MFDLIATGQRKSGRRGLASLVLSTAVHVLAIGVVALSVLFATDQLPIAPQETVTFVSVAPPPPPPPPPPAPAAAKPAAARPVTPTPRPQTVTTRSRPAPVQARASIEAPMPVGEAVAGLDGVPGGIVGGVPGGVPGGVIGGVVGGLPEAPLPPPPPAARAPVRVGGHIQAPALIARVPPVYPPRAANAGIEGVVILEATVGRDGRVEDVHVLRSFALLDEAALDAVRQWEYAPLLLNGQPQRFILTVTVSFSLS